ncbi:MAG: hypothetical protein J5699_05705, partial [Bacteroidales bacterium]|nr:hypothetical protein [Bacteroidales bacterium]
VLVMEEYRFPSEEAKIGDVVYETIGDAFAAANASNENCTITLLRSCAAAARLPLNDAGTGEITLDLRGKTLTMTNQIRVTGRKLTITDSFSDDPAQQGGIISTYNEGRVIYLEGAESECVINAGKIVSKNYGAIWLAGFLTLEGTASVTCETGIAVYLNGPEARMIFRGDASITAKSNAIALYGGKTVDVSGNVKAYSADGATFYPEVGTINISGGNFRRGGTGNGYVVYTAGPSSVVNISGGTFENFSAANANPTVSATSNGGSVYVTGGYFNSYGVNPVYCAGSDAAGGFCEVKGGCFNKGIQPRFAASGYVNVLNEDPATKDTYPFTVAPGETAAVLTQGSYIYNYGSLESGFTGANQRALANGNSLLTLQKDITAASTVNVNSDNGYSVTLDLNGHKVSSSANPAISSANTFIITDTGSEGDFATSGAVAVEITAGSTTVNSASLFGANNAFEVKGGSLKINNGYINGGGTSDIAVSGGTVTIGGGWYAHEPNASYIVDGCGSKPEYLSYNGRSFGYHIIATKFAATVNDEGYATLEAAVNAAKTYNGSASTVVIKLMESTECNVALDMTNASGKPVTFDLNGQTLTTTVSQFISAANEFLLTDSSANPGTIESNNTRVIYLHAAGGAGTATVEKVTIKSTFDKSTNSDATASANSAVYIYSNSSATKTLNLKNGAKIITPKCHGIYAGGNGNSTPSFLNVENAEITSGMYCLYFATATIEISGDETSLVSSDLEGKRAIYCGSSNANAKCHITGGYFYNGDGTTSAINTNYASHITIGGGYYCAALDGKYKLDSGFTLQDCNVTHTHKTTGTSLTYKKKIAK